MRDWAQRHPFWLLIGLALAVRVFPATVRFVVGSDEALYLTLGQNLAHGLGFTADGVTPHTEFAPGYPFFAAFVYALGGGLELPSQLALLLFGSLLPLPVYWLARQLTRDRSQTPPMLAGLFAALLPGLALGQPNFEAPTEQIYLALLYAGWALLWCGLQRRRLWHFGLAGITIGAAHIVRWEGMFFIVLGLAALAALLRRRATLPALLFVAGAAVFAIPYGAYLQRHTGSFVTPKGLLHQFHGAAFDARAEDPFAFERAYEQYEANVANLAAQPKLLTYLWANRAALPAHYLGNAITEARLLVTSGSLLTLVWIIPALIGARRLGWQRGLYAGALLAPLAIYPASVIDPRYFLPELPAAMIFAAFGWTHLLSKRSGRLMPTLFALTVAAFLAADLVGPFVYPRPIEYRTAGLALRGQLPDDAHMLARKRQIPFYAGVQWEWLPFDEVEGVLVYAAEHDAEYIALDARTTIPLRPQLAQLLDPTAAPPNLSPVYVDADAGVIVYEIIGR